jgi:hypothetical protein
MNHEHIQELIDRYYDTGLSDSLSMELFEHLGSCKTCRAYMHSVMQVRSFYQHDESVNVPASVDRRVFDSVQSIKNAEAKKYYPLSLWSTRILMPLPAAASIAVLIMIGSLLCSPLLFRSSNHENELAYKQITNMPLELQQQLEFWKEMNYAGKNNHNH